MSLKPNQMLQDRYRVVRIIKSGGMGSVYESIDTQLADSPCAIKEVLESARTGDDADYIHGRFCEEMKALYTGWLDCLDQGLGLCQDFQAALQRARSLPLLGRAKKMQQESRRFQERVELLRVSAEQASQSMQRATDEARALAP